MGNIAWKVMSTVAGIGAGKVAKSAVDKTWGTATGKKPPTNPADPDIAWAEAIAFSVVSGAIMGLGRMIGQKQAATAYRKTFGERPAELKTDGQ